MGVLTNYKKEIQKLEAQIKAYSKEKSIEFDSLQKQAEEMCRKYNDEIPIINSERVQMRDEIKQLYNFLKNFGDIGEKITIFDFVAEETKGVDDISSENKFVTEKKDANKVYQFSKFATGALCTVNPIFAPALIAFSVHDRSNNKKDFDKLTLDFEKAKVENENKLKKAKELIEFFKVAHKIAIIYRNIIVTVRDSISETIIPELSGIKAFLYADAIAQKIDGGENLQSIVMPTDIKELEDTRYNEHFLFVKNTCDYYNLITTLFKEKILTRIVEDNEISDEEYSAFYDQILHLDREKKNLESLTVFK